MSRSRRRDQATVNVSQTPPTNNKSHNHCVYLTLQVLNNRHDEWLSFISGSFTLSVDSPPLASRSQCDTKQTWSSDELGVLWYQQQTIRFNLRWDTPTQSDEHAHVFVLDSETKMKSCSIFLLIFIFFKTLFLPLIGPSLLRWLSPSNCLTSKLCGRFASMSLRRKESVQQINQ